MKQPIAGWVGKAVRAGRIEALRDAALAAVAAIRASITKMLEGARREALINTPVEGLERRVLLSLATPVLGTPVVFPSEVDLNWGYVPGATSYTVHRSGPTSQTFTVPADSTIGEVFSDTKL
jgi:hypothetical protein